MTCKPNVRVSEPDRFNFVILTVNGPETNEAKDIFKLENRSSDGFFQWNYLNRIDGQHFAVALVSLADQPGHAEAFSVTEKIVDRLDPDYILILGIAGGVQKNDVRLGDIVASRVLHSSGTINTGSREPRIEVINPPDDKLHRCVFNIDKEKWLRRINKSTRPVMASAEQAIRPRRKPNVFIEEVLSCPFLFDNPGDSIQNNILSLLPRVHAVEMEAGGSAKALAKEASKQKRVPGYIVIKGISDIIDNKQQKNEKSGESNQGDSTKKDELEVNKNKGVRKIWRKWAAHISATFARELVEEFSTSTWFPRPIKRVLPNPQKDIHYVDKTCCGVLRDIQPHIYSSIAAYNLKRITNNLNIYGECVFFTILAYPPKELWELAQRGYKESKGREAKNVNELTKWTNSTFPHFKMFSEFAESHTSVCHRILLLPDDDNWKDGLQQCHWNFFLTLNGNVRCFAIDRKSIETRTSFFTDYAILGDTLLLDYYKESSTLIISDIAHSEYIPPEVLELKKHFDEHRDGYPYIPLSTLKEEISPLFTT